MQIILSETQKTETETFLQDFRESISALDRQNSQIEKVGDELRAAADLIQAAEAAEEDLPDRQIQQVVVAKERSRLLTALLTRLNERLKPLRERAAQLVHESTERISSLAARQIEDQARGAVTEGLPGYVKQDQSLAQRIWLDSAARRAVVEFLRPNQFAHGMPIDEFLNLGGSKIATLEKLIAGSDIGIDLGLDSDTASDSN